MVFDSRSSSAIRGPSQIGRGLPLLQRRLRRLNLGSARRAAPTLPFFERCSRTMARKRPAKPQLEGGALPCSRPARCALRDICDVLPRRSPAPRLSPPILAAKPPPHPFVFDSRSSSAIRGPSQTAEDCCYYNCSPSHLRVSFWICAETPTPSPEFWGRSASRPYPSFATGAAAPWRFEAACDSENRDQFYFKHSTRAGVLHARK
jgi:hypothetical protein